MNQSQMHQIYDVLNNKLIGKPSTNVKRLRNLANKKDIEYGAYRYYVVNLEVTTVVADTSKTK